jgi:large subunit ribosomal protein L4
LNDRAEHDRVVMVDLPALEVPRTRDVAGFLAALELEGKTLILTDGRNENVYKSVRNLADVEVLAFGTESVYDVLWANTVVIERSALEGAAESDTPDAEPVVENDETEEDDDA